MKLWLNAEVEVKRKQPAWRTGEDGMRVGLVRPKLDYQPSGFSTGQDRAGAWSCDGARPFGRGLTGAGYPGRGCQEAGRRAPADSPRGGTKQSLVLGLLRRPSGAGLDELVAATGWLPHTTRAALTGLRQRGLAIERRKGEDGRSVYLIKNPEEALTSEAA